MSFTFVIDYFGVKYSTHIDLDHLNNTLQTKYTTTRDTTNTLYYGLTLKWEYQLRYVDIYMPGYIDKTVTRFAPSSPLKPYHSLSSDIDQSYGVRFLYTTPPDTPLCLLPKETTIVQESIYTILYYARAIDFTLHIAIGRLGSVRS